MFKRIEIVIACFLFLFFGIRYSLAKDFDNCQKCHRVESLDNYHNFGCEKCHVLPKYRNYVDSHKLIIKNPSSLKYVNVFCARCHKKDIYDIEHSLHGTLAGAIAITRYAWGAQNTLKPEFGIISVDNIKKIPYPVKYPNTNKPEGLVNNFLTRKCLRCHLLNNGTDGGVGALNLYRLKGCSACHMPINSTGEYMGKDKIMYGKSVYSEYHKFLKVPPMRNCLTCHNTEFVGTDFIGLFPHDLPYSFNSPILPTGTFPPYLYGTEFHHLISDIHFRVGMSCVDCHRKKGVMGDGILYASENVKGAIKVSCQDCHGGFSKKPSPKWVKMIGANYYFFGAYGRKWKVSEFNPNLVPHRMYHKNVSCSACHSAWQNENYQYNALLSYRRNYVMWENLTNQEDPYLQHFLKAAIKDIRLDKPVPSPKMPDRITQKMYPGIWYFGWMMRRWNYFTLGLSDSGTYKILRPLFEYRVSYVNSKGKVIVNSVNKTSDGRSMNIFVPYDPHTITLYGKSCFECHNNPYIINRNQYIHSNTVMHLLYGRVIYGKRINSKTIKNMMSNMYKRIVSTLFFGNKKGSETKGK